MFLGSGVWWNLFLALSIAMAALHMSAMAVVSLWSFGITESIASSTHVLFRGSSWGPGDLVCAESPPLDLHSLLSSSSWIVGFFDSSLILLSSS